MSTKVITDKVRFSYLNVFTPKAAAEGADPKYSVSLIIPKKNKKMVAKIEKAIEAAALAGKDKFKGGKVPKNLKTPLRDGDEDRPDDEAYADSYFINANSKNKPGLVDEDLEDIIDKSKIYSGCYGRAAINFYAYNVSGNAGVAAGLNNLQKLQDGEPLGGSPASAKSDFGDFDEEEDDLLG